MRVKWGVRNRGGGLGLTLGLVFNIIRSGLRIGGASEGGSGVREAEEASSSKSRIDLGIGGEVDGYTT